MRRQAHQTLTDRQTDRMSGFRWIQASLFLMLLYLTASAGQYLSIVVRDGDEVTLPCENETHDQSECENTKWLFSEGVSSPIEELVGFWFKSERLSLTARCSLVIKKVTVEDVGLYTCRRFRSGQQQGEDAQVFLSVIKRHEYKDKDMVTFCCSVSSYGWCTQRVKWLFKGKEVYEELTEAKTSQSYCSANVTFRSSPHIYGSFSCEVTDIFNGKVQQFTFSPQTSDEAAITVATTENDTKAPSVNDAKPQGLWRTIIVSVGLAALIITVVAVNVWARSKGAVLDLHTSQEETHPLPDAHRRASLPPPQVHVEEKIGTVNYENVGQL